MEEYGKLTSGWIALGSVPCELLDNLKMKDYVTASDLTWV